MSVPLLHNNLMESCSYVHKNTLLATKGGCAFAPPKSATSNVTGGVVFMLLDLTFAF